MSHLGLARRLRRNMTEAEARLWSRLRNCQMQGLKFLRQAIIEGFIADFACVEARLVIELDGSQHATILQADRARSDALAIAGYLVVRFWNNDVLADTDAVLAAISDALSSRPSAG